MLSAFHWSERNRQAMMIDTNRGNFGNPTCMGSRVHWLPESAGSIFL
jgi:hypothetical protein